MKKYFFSLCVVLLNSCNMKDKDLSKVMDDHSTITTDTITSELVLLNNQNSSDYIVKEKFIIDSIVIPDYEYEPIEMIDEIWYISGNQIGIVDKKIAFFLIEDNELFLSNIDSVRVGNNCDVLKNYIVHHIEEKGQDEKVYLIYIFDQKLDTFTDSVLQVWCKNYKIISIEFQA